MHRILGRKKNADELESEALQKPYPDPDRTITGSEFNEAKEKLLTARLQRDVVYYALNKIDEAGSKAQISSSAKIQLVQTYEAELKRIESESESSKRVVDLYELESAKEGLLKNFSEQLADLDGRIGQLRPLKGIAKWRKRIVNDPSETDVHRPSPHVIGQIISAYDLDSLQVEGNGLEGTGYITFRAVTPKGVFALRRKKGSASKIMAKHPDIGSNIEGQHALMLFLQEHGFPVAPPLLTREKETYVNITGVPWSLYPFIEGLPLEPTNLRQLRAAGGALARYHQLTEGYLGEPPLTQERFPKLFEEKLKDLRKHTTTLEASQSRLGFAEGLNNFKTSLSEIETEVKGLSYDSLPQTVIHGDYKPGNILFDSDNVAAVIDFGRSRKEARLFDIAKTVGGFVGTIDDTTFMHMTGSFLTAYESASALDNLERKALIPLIQARLASKAIDRLVRLAEEEDDAENLRRAERFNLLVQRLDWVRHNSESMRRLLEQPSRS